MRDHHREAPDTAVEVAEADDEVLACVLAGSVARGWERPDSDVDVHFVVTDGVALSRLPESQHESISRTFESRPFQAGDRTVTAWVEVTVDDVNALEDLLPYVKMSYERALEESSSSRRGASRPALRGCDRRSGRRTATPRTF